MLEKLRQCNNVGEIADCIRAFYHSFDDNNYIPGIFKEGSFLSTKENYDGEFYAKLIIRPAEKNIKQTWMKNNLAYGFIDGSDESEKNDISNYIYNLIVQKNYYRNTIYTLNPYLYNDNESEIYEKTQDSKLVANLVYYNPAFSTNEWPIILSNNGTEILLLKKSISSYINKEKDDFPRYVMSVEFEYRDKKNKIDEFNEYKKDGCLITKERTDEIIWLLGTLDIDFVIPNNIGLNIITNQLNGNIREINESNLNDDIDAGLIVFDNSCMKYLKKRYIFLEFLMVDMHTKDSVLIDFVDDKVVFWEGEFNKLPYEIKKELEKYNIKIKLNGIISKAMFEWQLNCNLDYVKFEYPYQKLGKYILENNFDLAYESRISVELPETNTDLINKVNDLLKLFSLKYNQLYKSEKGYFALERVLNNKYKPNSKTAKQLFDYFCYLLLEVISND